MARGAREKPKRLAEKLLTIRNTLGLSQSGMLKLLGAEGRMDYYRISEFESGKGEPSLLILLGYAQAAGVCVDVLIDDKIDLPTDLPAEPKHKGHS
ncbi:MAG TPA: helix-turn-helix transcriptional regulator [Pyrinomonadaceae bacterium]|jgi:transcriptional regulator with XRE-family HTH domain|nr:helix-turn-helix transcriptional regulator [Pyrinomonadaceae bacterium]